MQAIIIGAGRGARLMPTTADAPKCFAEVGGKRILDWALEAFRQNGLERIAFIGGYQIEKVKAAYPELEFRHNREWEKNNILASLFTAEDLMAEGFICSYSDILYTPRVIERVLASRDDLSLVVDTDWSARYTDRTEHPPDDAEKVTVKNGAVTRVHRAIPSEEAHGEYIGVMKVTAAGAARLREAYHRARAQFAGKPYREAALFEKAYLIQLLQEMVEAGERFAHVDTPGEYIEIDTQQDFDYARRNWK
ncbi:MAG: phosphocholine cytidylyltransferase family protein [Pirellulales bacterium]|nr:phosphocholine cytidylyltransferase family protein [Pirellulales bacterium]